MGGKHADALVNFRSIITSACHIVGPEITTFNKLTVRQNSGYQLPVYRLCSFQMGGTPGGDVNRPSLTDRFLCL